MKACPWKCWLRSLTRTVRGSDSSMRGRGKLTKHIFPETAVLFQNFSVARVVTGIAVGAISKITNKIYVFRGSLFKAYHCYTTTSNMSLDPLISLSKRGIPSTVKEFEIALSRFAMKETKAEAKFIAIQFTPRLLSFESLCHPFPCKK